MSLLLWDLMHGNYYVNFNQLVGVVHSQQAYCLGFQMRGVRQQEVSDQWVRYGTQLWIPR